MPHHNFGRHEATNDSMKTLPATQNDRSLESLKIISIIKETQIFQVSGFLKSFPFLYKQLAPSICKDKDHISAFWKRFLVSKGLSTLLDGY